MRAMGKLKCEVEKAKCTLSSQQSTRIEIESFEDDNDFSETLALVLVRDRVRRFTHSWCSSSLSLLCFVYAPSLEHKTPRRRVNMVQLLALVSGCVILLSQRSSTFYRPWDNLFLCWVCTSQLGITSRSPFRPVCNVAGEWKLLPTTKGTA